MKTLKEIHKRIDKLKTVIDYMGEESDSMSIEK